MFSSAGFSILFSVNDEAKTKKHFTCNKKTSVS